MEIVRDVPKRPKRIIQIRSLMRTGLKGVSEALYSECVSSSGNEMLTEGGERKDKEVIYCRHGRRKAEGLDDRRLDFWIGFMVCFYCYVFKERREDKT